VAFVTSRFLRFFNSFASDPQPANQNLLDLRGGAVEETAGRRPVRPRMPENVALSGAAVQIFPTLQPLPEASPRDR
jgi:hypothetical protein